MSELTNPQPSATPKRTRSAREQSGRGSKKPSQQATTLPPPAPSDLKGWKQYWADLGQPWRIMPEIDKQQQQILAKRRDTITPDIENGIYPFKGVKLSRADVEWLLATHEGSRGPVDWSDERQRTRQGLDLRGANLEGDDLKDLPLARVRGGLVHVFGSHQDEWYTATPDQREAAGVRLEKASLQYAHLEGAIFSCVHMEEANLQSAHLEGARLRDIHLEGAILDAVYFDSATHFSDLALSNEERGSVSLADVRWGGANLARIDWLSMEMEGNEERARYPHKLRNQNKPPVRFPRAARASRQLAMVLREQGLTQEADHYTYRAQVLQRRVFGWQIRNGKPGKLSSYLFSWFLAILTGYGYRMWGIVVAYALLILAFAASYWSVGIQQSHDISFWTALIVSVTAFHGRVFSNPFTPNIPDAQIILTGVEAVFGLIIEGLFVAMLVQKFFSR